MGVDIGAISGVLELKDEFSSRLDVAEAALDRFSEDTQTSLKAVAGAAGIITAAIAATTAAVIKLGERGSDVNDVRSTLEQFAGSAQDAEAIMQKLRAGTKDTVDDFVLMKEASHLLSAGVKLNAEDFGTLGQAAFVLQNRGLGPTKQQLELVSDALVTGRTRALAMSLGVIDAGDAEAKLAERLGVTKDQLSETAKVEAKRQAVMELLNKAVKEAGHQERDFGEELEYVQAQITNWVDRLGSAVAASPVLARGLQELSSAVHEAFGPDNQNSIKTTLGYIEDGATMLVDIGQGAIVTARVFNTAWSIIKTAVLAVEGAIALIPAALAEVNAAATEVAGKFHLVSPEQVREAEEFRDRMRAIVKSFGDQADEAAKGIVQNSAFDKTLDGLSATLFRVKDAMNAEKGASDEASKAHDVQAENARKLSATQKALQQDFIDRQKVETELWKVEEKSLKETEQLWNEYFALRVKHGGTTLEAQKAQIEEWFNDEVSKLDASDRNWQEHYNALKAVADEKLNGIAVDWDFIAAHSKQALQDQLDVATNTYNEMMVHASNFTRETLDAQLQKVRDLQDAVRGYGKDFVDAENAAAKAANEQADAMDRVAQAAEDAAKAQRMQGGSYTYDLTTIEGVEEYRKGNTAATISWSDEQIVAFAKKGGTLQQLINMKIIDPYGNFGIGHSMGYAKGTDFVGDSGPAMVGEEGPEIVNLRRGSSVTPMGNVGGSITNHFYVNGTATDVARKISTIIMDDLKRRRQFGLS